MKDGCRAKMSKDSEEDDMLLNKMKVVSFCHILQGPACTQYLGDMGAQIILCDPHRATVIGLDRKYALRGIKMTSPDIRAGVSLLIAAMSANGTSVIDNIEQIDRGYQNIDERLNALGAKITRID